MNNIGNVGLWIGIIGGIGLGLILGSEFFGRYTTLFGAALVLISILSMIIQTLRGKK